MKSSDHEIGENRDAELRCVGLSSREIQILRHLALGKGDKQISTDLMISVKTVNHHVSNIMFKLSASNRTHAVVKALLARQIEMRTTDSPIRVFNRRQSDQDKMVQVVANYMSVSVACQMPWHVDDPVPWHTPEDQIKSESTI